MISERCNDNEHNLCTYCECSCHHIRFTIEELKALSRALETQYLAYDDEELHTVVNKIFRILKENKK